MEMVSAAKCFSGEPGAGHELREQLLALDRLAGRLDHSESLLASARAVGQWIAPSGAAYFAALVVLSTQVEIARAQLEVARRGTRWALEVAPAAGTLGWL